VADDIYLDWNATTPLHPDVAQAMREAERIAWANPSSVHAAGRRARGVLDAAREQLAEVCDVHPRDVVFTSSATEANNLALCGALGLATSRLEHPSVVRSAEALEARGVPVVWLDVLADGRVCLESLARCAGSLPPGSTVSVMAANHETGVLQPLGAIAELVRRAQLRLHVDAVQALGKTTDRAWAAADSVALAAHKLRGPKGIGALAFREGTRLAPLLVGGAQERGLRAGTQDAVLAAGFKAALQRLPELQRRQATLSPLRDRFEAGLAAFAVVNGTAPRLSHVSNLSFSGFRGDELVAALDLLGIRVASGSACSAGTTEPSEVISAMLGRERARSAVRVSLGESTTAAEVERAIALFHRVLGRDPSRSSSDT
jgi:cysteine desulfurase